PDTLADPVPLDFLQRFAEFYFFQSLKESFGIFGDTQAPLAHPTLYYGVATAIAYAVYHFIVGEDSAKRLAPVDVGIPQVGKSVLHQDLLLHLLIPRLPLVSGKDRFVGTGNCIFNIGEGVVGVPFFLEYCYQGAD